MTFRVPFEMEEIRYIVIIAITPYVLSFVILFMGIKNNNDSTFSFCFPYVTILKSISTIFMFSFFLVLFKVFDDIFKVPNDIGYIYFSCGSLFTTLILKLKLGKGDAT